MVLTHTHALGLGIDEQGSESRKIGTSKGFVLVKVYNAMEKFQSLWATLIKENI